MTLLPPAQIAYCTCSYLLIFPSAFSPPPARPSLLLSSYALSFLFPLFLFSPTLATPSMAPSLHSTSPHGGVAPLPLNHSTLLLAGGALPLTTGASAVMPSSGPGRRRPSSSGRCLSRSACSPYPSTKAPSPRSTAPSPWLVAPSPWWHHPPLRHSGGTLFTAAPRRWHPPRGARQHPPPSHQQRSDLVSVI